MAAAGRGQGEGRSTPPCKQYDVSKRSASNKYGCLPHGRALRLLWSYDVSILTEEVVSKLTKKPQGPRPSSKDKRVGIRLTEGEHDTLSAYSEELGLSLSAYMRAVSLDAVGDSDVVQQISQPEDTRDDAALWELHTELNRIGVNVNQIARKVNADAALFLRDRGMASQLLSTQQELLETLKVAVETLEGLS